MRAVIIGAGRGSRLGPNTAELPKTLVEVMGRPILDFIVDALSGAGFRNEDIVFICGYKAEVLKARYPGFTFVHNDAWEHHNVLFSLLKARPWLTGGFISTYADIVYDAEIVRLLRESPDDLVLGADVAWRRRYANRSQHPESDAEKMRLNGRQVVELGRHIPPAEAQGEFIGVMKASAHGCARLLAAFDRARAAFSGRPYREGRPFERAYLIDLLADMVEQGETITSVFTNGNYMEIDTEEDLRMAEQWWHGRPAAS